MSRQQVVPPPVCGVGHMQLCTAVYGAHTCAREPLMHFDPSGAAGAARPRAFDDSHPHCLLYYLAYNDRKVQYNERNGRGEKQGQDSQLQQANWCSIVLCDTFPVNSSPRDALFIFSAHPRKMEIADYRSNQSLFWDVYLPGPRATMPQIHAPLIPLCAIENFAVQPIREDHP